MKIVITGASGFVGQLLVSRLALEKTELVLVGRNEAHLKKLFPDLPICDYSQISTVGKGADFLLHLAVANSDAKLSDAEFHKINVDFLLEVANNSRAADIDQFINVSSVHALQPQLKTAYAISKRAGAKALLALDGMRSRTIYLPLVYGDRWAGKLAFLNKTPVWLAMMVFHPIAAFKPTLHIDKLATYILAQTKEHTDESSTILADDKSKNRFYSWAKRAMDIVFALIVTLLLGWLMLLIWAAVRATSPGPGIFKQIRVGRSKKIFTCYKFRTMRLGTEQLGTHEISSSSVTSIGAILRKTKMDELPQIINIFRNELSLIGPRPCLPNQNELVAAREAAGVFEVKPGISGLAQINDIDMSRPKLLAEWDARYIALRGLASDLSIAFATATGRGQGDKTS